MDTNNEILDAIEILTNKKIGENITKILTGICKSVNINNNTCVMDSNGVISTVQFYGNPPEVNELYRIFVPSNNMSQSFIVVPPKFTVNPNLLDNWYFANPVNQRGLMEYTGTEYAVDRWSLYTDGGNVAISNGYLDIYSSKQHGAYLAQKIDPELAKVLAGKTVTWSVLAAGGDIAFSANINKDDSYVDSFVIEPNTLSFKTLTLPTGFTNLSFVFAGNIAGRVCPIAAKLELGSTQTLAHLENGNWVLNEIPKYEDVLSNCQRYAFNVVDFDDNFEILGSGFAMDSNLFFCFIPTPTTLRSKPSISYSGLFTAVRNTAANDGIVINTMTVDRVSNNGVSIICTGTTAFEAGAYYTLWGISGSTTNSLILSADL